MKTNILTLESFSRGRKNYYLDYKQARNQSKYISFTLSEAQFGSAYVRQSIPVFEEDFGVFIASLSSLMTAVLQFGKEYESVKDM